MRERVPQREHRPPVTDLVERRAGRGAADALGRRVRGDELRKGLLERDQLAEQLVVFGVADLGRILDVVEAVRALDLLDHPGMAGGGGFDVQRGRLLDERRIDGQLGRHRPEDTGGGPTTGSTWVRVSSAGERTPSSAKVRSVSSRRIARAWATPASPAHDSA